MTIERMIGMNNQNNRRVLAATLRSYERIIQSNNKELTDSDVLTRAVIERCINLTIVQIEAVKRFAREIGIINYKENYDMTTQQLIKKLEAE